VAEKRKRSPRHPHHSLQDAIERVKQIYRAEHTHSADREAIAEDLGYTGLNGASVKWISTLKNYNLLEDEGNGLMRVSDDAVTLIELPEDDFERALALQRVAFAPELFAALRDIYPERLPSDANMRHFLIRNMGFLPKAVDGVIRVYRDNLTFVAEEVGEYTAGQSVEEQPMEVTQVQPQPSTVGTTTPRAGNGTLAPVEDSHFTESLEYRISGDSKVRLLFDGVVTREAIGKLIAYLELGQDDFPSKEEIERSVVEQPALEAPAIEPTASE
jgi:hypothetical protein